MTNVIQEIEKKFKVFRAKGVSKGEIEKAEKELGLEFASDYKEYLENYGALSFSSHEFTGLGVEGYLNVISATKSERKLGKNFPSDCILIENVAMEGLLIIQDKSGAIYSFFDGKKSKIADSLTEYFASIAK